MFFTSKLFKNVLCICVIQLFTTIHSSAEVRLKMKKNILLLEDDAIQAKALKQMINNYSANIEVYYAMNLEQADNLLKKEIIFNAFFLDISLDNKNADHAGLSLARQIRSVTRYQHTPFVFITAFPEHIYSAVNQLHCFAYLVKPYSEKELHKQLACLFEPKHTILLKTSENIHIRLSLDALQYVNSNGRYLTYVTASSKYHSRQYTLKKTYKYIARWIYTVPPLIYNQPGIC